MKKTMCTFQWIEEVERMKSFRIKNIKAFKDSGNIEFKPITIFVGKNSCGKSSLLRFPTVLAQTALSRTDSPLMFYGKMLDYGNYEDVVFGRTADSMTFEIDYDVNIHNVNDARYTMIEEDQNDETSREIHRVGMKITINKNDKRMHVESAELCVDGECLSGYYYQGDNYRVELNYIYENYQLTKERYEIEVKDIQFDNFFTLYDAKEVFCAIVGIVVNEDKKPVSLEVGQELYNRLFNLANPYSDDQLTEEEKLIKRIKGGLEYSSAMMSHVYTNFNSEAYRITYIGPFRESPERVYRDSESQSADVGVKGENVSTLLIRDYQNNSKLINAISKWLYKTMGYTLTIKDMGSGLFQIMLANDKGIESNILDVGFGISQVLPIIVQIINTSLANDRRIKGRLIKGKAIYVEQPELHLHPAAQAELADIFVSCVLDNEDTCLVVETHSEHLIRKLQVLVSDKKNDFSADLLRIYYVDKDENGVANVQEMKIMDNGKFEQKWPTGFFDKAHELSMELLKNSAEN